MIADCVIFSDTAGGMHYGGGATKNLVGSCLDASFDVNMQRRGWIIEFPSSYHKRQLEATRTVRMVRS